MAILWFVMKIWPLIFSLQTAFHSLYFSLTLLKIVGSYLALVSMSSLHQFSIPMTEGLDPVSMLTDDATVAQWNNEGLPGDKMSTQNATILTNCE